MMVFAVNILNTEVIICYFICVCSLMQCSGILLFRLMISALT